jgi:hypothetical protein
MVQTQMAPNQSMPEDGNPSANDIGAAVRWLDMGANGQAMQAIIRAINAVGSLSTGMSKYRRDCYRPVQSVRMRENQVRGRDPTASLPISLNLTSA